MNLHIAATARNGAIVKALQDLGWNQAELARRAKVPASVVTLIVRMQYHKKHCPKTHGAECVQKIAALLGITVEEVLPIALAGKELRTEADTFVDIDERALLECSRPEDRMIEVETAAAVNVAVATLPARHAEVLRRRFGLNNTKPETLEEIARDLSLSRERVRQIEVLATNQLRTTPLQEEFA